MVGPMKLMMLAELGSTGALVMSVFQRLEERKGTKPLRLAPWPVDICEQAEFCVEPLTWKSSVGEVALPGLGFCTATGKVPAVEALPVAVSWVEETKVVESAELLRRTCAPETKSEPVTVRVKLPVLVEVGEMLERTGMGFQRVTAAVADADVSTTLVAVMEMVLGEGRVAGAE